MARLRGSSWLFVCCLAACGDSLGPTADFLASRSRWERRRPATYVYEFQRSCFCGSEATQAVRIAVSGVVVTAVTRVADGQTVPPDQVNQFFRVTIDSLFRIVADALADAHAVTARYDAVWGHPTHVSIDYIQNAIDDEVSYTAGLSTGAP